MEPPHSYVRETSSAVVHHEDYLGRRDDQALCGAAFENPAPLGPTIRPAAVCPDCEAKLAEYHLTWWREQAKVATAELDLLRVKYHELAEYVENQRPLVAQLQHPAHVSGDPNGANAERGGEIDGVPQAGSPAEQGVTSPPSLLDQARKELLELCRQFEETVPFWRVKNSMDAFSDKLKSEERVLLAQEIGAAGSLILWCTREIERLGLQVSNNPVHADADAMMDAWTEDYYQTPKKTKWRLGRSP